jgi:predicted negative regulator of RcsB-dependent stress response
MDVAFVHELLGDICMRLENYTDAIEHYSNAMQQNYGSPGLLDKYLSVCNKIHNL